MALISGCKGHTARGNRGSRRRSSRQGGPGQEGSLDRFEIAEPGSEAHHCHAPPLRGVCLDQCGVGDTEEGRGRARDRVRS